MSHIFDVTAVAKLARITLSKEEALELSANFEGILGYIDEIKNANIPESREGVDRPFVRNIMRDDVESYESGLFKEDILNETPVRKGDYIQVKKMISTDSA